MKERLRFWFDEEGDTLDISLGRPKKAISRELKDDILVRVSTKTKKVIGLTILNFTKRFRKANVPEEIATPLRASISIAS